MSAWPVLDRLLVQRYERAKAEVTEAERARNATRPTKHTANYLAHFYMPMESSDASYFQSRDSDECSRRSADYKYENQILDSGSTCRSASETGIPSPQQGKNHKAYKPNGVPKEFGMCTRQIRLGQLSTLRDNELNNSNHEGSHHFVSHYSCLSARGLAS